MTTSNPVTGTEIRTLTSNSTHTVLAALAQDFERATGHRLSVSADTAKGMLARIKGGETADVAVLLTPAIDELTQLGKISPASRRPFARSRIGVAVLAGAPKPDISSVDALRRTLLDAKSVAHTVHGASGMYVPTLLERLGIADKVKPKTVTRPGGLIGKVVATGEAEVAVQQISELLAVPGIEVVGPLPDEVQKVFETTAGIFADTGQRTAAEALLRFFGEPDSAATFRANGLEPC
ncbi:MAG: substrate-binding domain-containing protein [Burkholderiales bacterium]|nr:substrate-binding domain-containing protein [Burkholderiales bacterium]